MLVFVLVELFVRVGLPATRCSCYTASGEYHSVIGSLVGPAGIHILLITQKPWLGLPVASVSLNGRYAVAVGDRCRVY